MKKRSLILTALFASLALVALPSSASAADHEKDKDHAGTLVAALHPTEGNEAAGIVTFEALDNGKVKVTARVTGLKPDSMHAIHVHQYGDATASDGTSAGGHFNPAGHEHGLPDEEMRHAGDFGNLEADADGNATYSLTVDNISLHDGDHAILGRSVIVHAGQDKGTQPTGDAGPRIAQGVIGIANPDTLSTLAIAEEREVQSATLTAEPNVSQKVERGLETAARETKQAVNRGAEELGEALRKAGRELEEAID